MVFSVFLIVFFVFPLFSLLRKALKQKSTDLLLDFVSWFAYLVLQSACFNVFRRDSTRYVWACPFLPLLSPDIGKRLKILEINARTA